MIVALFPLSCNGGKGNNIVSCEESIFLLTNNGDYTPLLKNCRKGHCCFLFKVIY